MELVCIYSVWTGFCRTCISAIKMSKFADEGGWLYAAYRWCLYLIKITRLHATRQKSNRYTVCSTYNVPTDGKSEKYAHAKTNENGMQLAGKIYIVLNTQVWHRFNYTLVCAPHRVFGYHMIFINVAFTLRSSVVLFILRHILTSYNAYPKIQCDRWLLLFFVLPDSYTPVHWNESPWRA